MRLNERVKRLQAAFPQLAGWRITAKYAPAFRGDHPAEVNYDTANRHATISLVKAWRKHTSSLDRLIAHELAHVALDMTGHERVMDAVADIVLHRLNGGA